MEPNNLVGTMLGQYQVMEELGRGGMAIVYKAWQASLRRYVAIKVLFSHLTGPELTQRFQQEAIVAANLSHYNIVTIYEVGQHSGVPFIVMEYVSGRSLAEIISQDGVMPLSRLIHILNQVADALDYAHQRHFVHRDIKPSNILVTPEDRAIITDFGIAKALEGSGATVQLTATGTIVGTPAYMSPEQIQGLPVGYQSDLYSLGIVCYEMLGGRPPFDGTTTAAVLYAQVHNVPPGIRQVNSSVPKLVEDSLARMLAKEPENRFPSAAAFVASLNGSWGGESPGPRHTGKATPSTAHRTTAQMGGRQVSGQISKPRRSRAVPALLVVAIVLVALALGAVVILLNQPPQPTPPPLYVLASPTPESTAPPTDVLASPTPEPTPLAPPTEQTVADTETAHPELPSDLAFHSNRDGDYEIYILSAATGEIQQVTDHPAEDIRPSWSPDGSQIAFQSDRDGNKEIYVVDRGGGSPRRLTVEDGRDMKPDWSPDGSKILFESDRDGNPEIYVMEPDGGNPVRLTDHPGQDWAPAWSPDGRQIVFMSDRDTEQGTYEIYVMDADGTNVQRLTENTYQDASPDWSPDGRRIVFSSDRTANNGDIYVISVAGESDFLMRLTASPGQDALPVWSPEGSRIAFQSDREGYTQIYVVGADGSQEERLIPDASDSGHPRWAPADS